MRKLPSSNNQNLWIRFLQIGRDQEGKRIKERARLRSPKPKKMETMKSKIHTITLAWACTTLALVIASVWFWIEGIPVGVFWSRMTAIMITAIFLPYWIAKAGLVKYYVLDPRGKDAFLRGASHKEMARFQGSLQKCCKFLNEKPYRHRGMIVDPDGHPAGKKQNRRWVAKF